MLLHSLELLGTHNLGQLVLAEVIALSPRKVTLLLPPLRPDRAKVSTDSLLSLMVEPRIYLVLVFKQEGHGVQIRAESRHKARSELLALHLGVIPFGLREEREPVVRLELGAFVCPL